MKVYEVPLTFAKYHIDILGERLHDHWSSGLQLQGR